MQKYINVVFVVVLIALGFYIVRLQVFNELRTVQLDINGQAQTITNLRTDISAIADFLNKQIQAQADAAK